MNANMAGKIAPDLTVDAIKRHQMRELLSFVHTFSGPNEAIVITGDFNHQAPDVLNSDLEA